MPFEKFVFLYPYSFIFFFSPYLEEVSHKINGLRSLSIDQFLFLKSDAFSIRKRESKGIVALRFAGDNLLCSSKNCSFLRYRFKGFRTFLNLGIIDRTQKTTPNNGELQIVLLSIFLNDNLETICNPELSESLV